MAKLPDSVIAAIQAELDEIKQAQALLTAAEIDQADKDGIAQAANQDAYAAQAVTAQASAGVDEAVATFLSYVEGALQPIQPA